MSEKIERNILVVAACWVKESFLPILAGVLLTLLLVGGGWLVGDYKEVRERALRGQQLWEWVQVQQGQKQQGQVQVGKSTAAPAAEEKK